MKIILKEGITITLSLCTERHRLLPCGGFTHNSNNDVEFLV